MKNAINYFNYFFAGFKLDFIFKVVNKPFGGYIILKICL